MRIAIDATPAAVQRGGVGRYARELLRGLVLETRDDRFILAVAAGETEAGSLLDGLPPGAWREVRRLPARERLMTAFWQRLRAPVTVERWIGRCDVYHGLDFTLPPTRAPGVITVHDLSFLLAPRFADPRLVKFLRSAVPRSLDRAAAVITVSAAVAGELADAYPKARHKIVAVPNGVRIPAERPERCDPERPRILMVGTVEPRKNHLALLSAMDEVRAALPDAELTIVGRQGWRAAGIVARIEAGEARGHVRWLRDAGDADVEREYATVTLAVFPSHYEGFGLPVLEAMARGVPIVASDIVAHREVAGDAALFAAPDSASEIAARIVRLLDDGALRGKLGVAGPARAEAFTWGETARRTLRVYRSVGKGGGD